MTEYLTDLWLRNKYFRPFVIISCLLILFTTTFLPLNSLTL